MTRTAAGTYLTTDSYAANAPTATGNARDTIVARITNARFGDDGVIAQVGSPAANVKAAVPSGSPLKLGGTFNIQARSSADENVTFIHIEPDKKIRMAATAKSTLLTTSPPDVPHLVARNAIWAFDDFLAELEVGTIPGATYTATAAPFKCPGNALLGIDKDVVPDRDPFYLTGSHRSDFTQTKVRAWPNDHTLLAQAHETNAKFVFYHLDSINYVKPVPPAP